MESQLRGKVIREALRLSADLSIFYLLIVPRREVIVFSHARSNEISWKEKSGRPLSSHVTGYLGSPRHIPIPNIAQSVGYTIFFVSRSSIDLSAPSDAQWFVWKPLLLRRPFTPAMVTSGRRPLYNFLLGGNRFSTRVTIPFKRPRLSHSQF